MNSEILSICAIVAAAVATVATLTMSIIQTVKTAHVSKALDDSKKRGTYFVCPHCKRAVEIKDVDFILPGGSIDNNLNGIPDHNEK